VPDVRLVQQGEFPDATEVSVDWLLLNDGTLDQTQDLATAVIVALGTDRLADITDELPDPDSTDRRGWWGDMDTQLIWNGWPIGSRLWLLSRAKMTDGRAQQGSTLTRIKFYIQEALQPFIDLKIASSMYVAVSRVDRQRINALVRLYRGPKTAIELQYQVLWQDIIE
jgi:phage gp46-like protein